MFTSGQLLAERYRLERRIAVGGMGEVWEAADTRLGRNVAVKLLRPELCGDPEFLHRFRTEARMTASLNHPGIAAVHDYGETAAVTGGPEDTAYLVMELVEGEPLAALLARGGRLAADHALDILEQAGHALQAAHERGLVHRDIKPGNILVTPVGKVKVTDFGIAKAADAAPVTRSGMVMGTAHYIAPEQAVGQDAEPASDVYSLAVVGYECLAGRRPFLSENAVTVAMMHIRDMPPPLPPDVPPGARAVVETTLVKDPRRRYRSGGEFANAVAAARSGHPLPPPSGLAMPFQGVAGLVVPPAMSPPVAGPGMTGHLMVPGPHPTGGLPPVGVHGPPSGPGGGVFPLAPPPPAPAGSGHRVGLWILVALLVALALVLGALGIREAVRSSSKQGSPLTGNTGRGLSGPGDVGRSAQPAISVQAQSEVSVDHGGDAGWQTTDTADQSLWRGSRTGVGLWSVGPSCCIVNEVTPEVTPVGSIAIGSRVVMRHEPVVTG